MWESLITGVASWKLWGGGEQFCCLILKKGVFKKYEGQSNLGCKYPPYSQGKKKERKREDDREREREGRVYNSSVFFCLL